MQDRLHKVTTPLVHLVESTLESRNTLGQVVNTLSEVIDAPVDLIESLVHASIRCGNRSEHSNASCNDGPELGAHGRTIP